MGTATLAELRDSAQDAPAAHHHPLATNPWLQAGDSFTGSMKIHNKQSQQVVGVILAGGKGKRMGGREKPLQSLQGRALIEHVIERAAPQVDELILSSNSDPALYTQLQLPMIADHFIGHSGPLLGISSAMVWATTQYAQAETLPYLACFAADVPFFPASLVAQLLHGMMTSGSQVAVAREAGQLQPLFSVWDIESHSKLDRAIAAGVHGPKPLLPELNSITVDVTAESTFDFANINTLQELQALEQALSRFGRAE
jgi:molybdopterin-guanine dinucleotide biosynthesis protein A